ncbi:purine-binding chemotaxis protein CheW [Aliikangiella marina]|uniref:Chemotaxis protein CheW n=1 Tax=Aliikangiella marina TaxID=1712262 RepID=A0A545TDP8_9GAMM|nr:chemotaxis protein CheW [Aliikangiella marina]TQV75339.1 purine-binding chemotaxis protein CheW [Aliikangiella marina]
MAESLRKNSKAEADESVETIEQCLTFMVSNDEFGLDILAVQEIHGWLEPRPIPNTPDYIKGVIDWRGTIVPIVDLRIKFNYPQANYEKTTVVIILKTFLKELEQFAIVGVVVDAVSDVVDIKKHELKDAPTLGSKVDTDYIKGIAKVNNKMTVILELQKLINLENLDG